MQEKETVMTALAVIPQSLKDCSQWVVWRRETREGKATKVPYTPVNGNTRASVTKPTDWGSFEQAAEALARNQFDGIGYVLTADDPFTGVDLDHCLDPTTGVIERWALAIVDQLHSYTERSPSGTGLRIFVKGTLLQKGRKKGPIEFYSEARYLTVTGDHLVGTPLMIEDRHKTLQLVHAAHFSPPTRNGHHTAKPITADDETQLARMFASKNGAKIKKLWEGDSSDHRSHSEADFALCCGLAFWFGRDPERMDRLFRKSGLMREKWDSPRGESTYGKDCVANACAKTTETYQEPETATLMSVMMADVVPEKVSYLWEARVAFGKLNLFVGQPSGGKTWLSLFLAALHSHGGLWPDGTVCPKGVTLLMGSEDGLADTVRPRLDLLKADTTQIHAITGKRGNDGTPWSFNLMDDLEPLRRTVRETKATLIIIDPLTAYLGKIDSYKDDQVRSVLGPLAQMAEEERVAILGIIHPNKSTTATSILNRMFGSIGFGAAARCVFGVAYDPDDETKTRRLFMPIKMNIAVLPPTLAFRIGAEGVEWEKDPVTGLSQERVFGMPKPEETDTQREARAFLRDLLRDGKPMPSNEIYAEGKKEGFSPKLLRRAAKAEKVKIDKEGMKGGWTWTMPF